MRLSLIYIVVFVRELEDGTPPSRLPWWLSGKESTCNEGDMSFDPRVRKIPWRRRW